jgi:CelD/BcsL family acetyltransferase involved in cellulose biosynthesis
MVLSLERLPGPEALAGLTPEWEALDAALSPRIPFTSPLWNCLWWKHLRAHGLFVRDEFFGCVLRDGVGRLVAVAPMMITRRPAVGPLCVRQVQFFGADRNITEIRGPVCRPEDQEAVLRALSDHFETQMTGWEWLQWGGIRSSVGAGRWLDTAGLVNPVRSVPDYYLVLPSTWQELKSRLSRNMKEAVRKCYNSLKRDGHVFRFQVLDKPDNLDAALARFFTLHAERARQGNSVLHLDIFRGAAGRNFFRDYARCMAERGQLRIFEVAVGDRVVATRVGFVLGGELYLYYSGYDPAWARYSIMTTVLVEIMKWAIEHGFLIVNLSTGDDISKRRWRPVETSFYDAVQFPREGRSIAYSAYRHLRLVTLASWLGRAS